MKTARIHQNLVKTIRNSTLYPVATLILIISATSAADAGGHARFQQGQAYYQSGNYEGAITEFQAAVEAEPENSVYHHWLGKSYGELARRSGIFKAYELSKKTCYQLEQAVTLDDTNIDALTDLLEYYEQAPSFLGGGKDKAEKIRLRLKELNYNVVENPEV